MRSFKQLSSKEKRLAIEYTRDCINELLKAGVLDLKMCSTEVTKVNFVIDIANNSMYGVDGKPIKHLGIVERL